MSRNALTDMALRGVNLRLMPDPQDYSAKFNTSLPADLEAMFQQWAQQSGRDRDASDFDIRGAWLAAQQGDPRVSWLVGNGPKESRGHLPDQWKKPNHPTFSDGSQYQSPGVTGGQWQQNGEQWNYLASPHNMRTQQRPGALRQYFDKVEPGNALIEPNWSPLQPPRRP